MRLRFPIYSFFLLAFAPLSFAQIDDRGYPVQGAADSGFSFEKEESFLTSDIDIPVFEDRDEGPSIEVSEFRFDELAQFPELGITRATVEALAEDLRRKYSSKPGELSSGYTLGELQAVAELLPVMTPYQGYRRGGEADSATGSESELTGAEGSVAELAYSQQELEEIADYLRSIIRDGPRTRVNLYEVEALERLLSDLVEARDEAITVDIRAIDINRLADLVDLVKRQQADRGLSYVELEEVAAEITRYYRQQGVFLARAYLPVQNVEDGVVRLAVLEGVLGSVGVEGNKKYSDERLLAPFNDSLGRGVTAEEIEESLYLINDYPGLDVYGYFAAGAVRGETALNLQVNNEKSWQITTRADNHGSRFTGDDRLYTTVDWFNPTGRGDVLSIGYLKSWSPVNSDVAVLQYRMPVLDERTNVFFSTDYNDFAIDDADNPAVALLDITGTNTSYVLGIDRQFVRRRAQGIRAGVSLSEKETEVDSPFIDVLPTPGEKVHAIDFNGSFDNLFESWRLLNIANVTVSYGEFQDGVDDYQDEEFYKVAVETSTLKFMTIPFFDAESHLIVKSSLRYTDSDLPAFEQMPIGGVNAVRAFSVSDFAGDQAAYLGLEWYFNLPSVLDVEVGNRRLNDMFDMAIFYDASYATAIDNDPLGKNVWASLSGAGLLFQLSWRDIISTKISFSKPMSSRTNDPEKPEFGDDADSIQTYIELVLRFDS